MYLGDKKDVVQSAAFTTPTVSTSRPVASGTFPKPGGSGTSLFAMLAGPFFADIEAHGIYEEFLNADDNI